MASNRFILATFFLILHWLAACTGVASASTQPLKEGKGLEIMTKKDELDDGWRDMQADITMVLIDAKGRSKIREIALKSLEGVSDGDKSLLVFVTPKDIKGSSFLSVAHPEASDDQWIYLPALRRVKRINGNNKSGEFMGSEFSYEDMTPQSITKYRYRYIEDSVIEGEEYYVIESYPLDKSSGYSKRIHWINKSNYSTKKIQFYGKNKRLLKTLTLDDYEHYNDKFWRAGSSEMINHRTGKSTKISYRNISFNTGLTDRDFSKNNLKHAH